MSTSLILRPGVSLRRGADRHQTRIGWLHGRHLLDAGDAARLTAAGERRLGAAEPSEVLIWEMHASLSPTASS